MAKKSVKIQALNLPKVEVLKLSAAKGLPVTGASIGWIACCTVRPH